MALLYANYDPADYTRECQGDKEKVAGKIAGLGKQEGMKLVHEAVIERGKVFEALGTGFL
jgi:hypothetical protein